MPKFKKGDTLSFGRGFWFVEEVRHISAKFGDEARDVYMLRAEVDFTYCPNGERFHANHVICRSPEEVDETAIHTCPAVQYPSGLES